MNPAKLFEILRLSGFAACSPNARLRPGPNSRLRGLFLAGGIWLTHDAGQKTNCAVQISSYFPTSRSAACGPDDWVESQSGQRRSMKKAATLKGGGFPADREFDAPISGCGTRDRHPRSSWPRSA